MTHCHMHMTKKTNTPHSRHKFIFTSEFVGSFFFHFVSLFVVFFFLFRLLSFLDKQSNPVAWSVFRHSRRLSTGQDSPHVLHSPSLHVYTKEKTVRKKKKKQVVKAFDFCFFSNTGGPQGPMTFQTWLRIARDLQLQT